MLTSVFCLQTGKGHLQPNDAFGTPSVVKYGLSASTLNMTATGTAQARSVANLYTICAQRAGHKCRKLEHAAPWRLLRCLYQ